MRVVVALPFHGVFGVIYAALAAALAPLSAAAMVDVLKATGIHPAAALLIAMSMTFFSLAASPINVVVYTVSRRHYIPVVDYVVVLGIPIPVPRVALHEEKSYIAVNVGGAVVPLAVATYLLAKIYSPHLVAAIAAASLLTYSVSRVIPSVGVVTPAFAPPIIAALSALIAGGGPAATYVTAVYGTIIGADLMNMRKILSHRPPLVSIGGAGVFDGIYLSGLLATLLSKLL
ncbi:DUF1614 domain-containing protein [Pyrobaculum neutrophilum]|uniref:DUF1614 domain-containing protein n=1 Tax=Pyrobaculum neutrophilum (strain DSM 2338 / JCM 9278 / NBRC 100436 / V24Sta) TaxID=444157 RepID=B1Y8Y4_PYRNV|nr:DUF1614 domain-containing protein [Pyrobaculum neutrophilum]ACB40213.1 protein of unknown function DUF1614 [Pyrobaculum neutrophilum V24Sta]